MHTNAYFIALFKNIFHKISIALQCSSIYTISHVHCNQINSSWSAWSGRDCTNQPNHHTITSTSSPRSSGHSTSASEQFSTTQYDIAGVNVASSCAQCCCRDRQQAACICALHVSMRDAFDNIFSRRLNNLLQRSSEPAFEIYTHTERTNTQSCGLVVKNHVKTRLFSMLFT